jgi:hypothetical protein
MFKKWDNYRFNRSTQAGKKSYKEAKDFGISDEWATILSARSTAYSDGEMDMLETVVTGAIFIGSIWIGLSGLKDITRRK